VRRAGKLQRPQSSMPLPPMPPRIGSAISCGSRARRRAGANPSSPASPPIFLLRRA
jgi:hypothetical protein